MLGDCQAARQTLFAIISEECAQQTYPQEFLGWYHIFLQRLEDRHNVCSRLLLRDSLLQSLQLDINLFRVHGGGFRLGRVLLAEAKGLKDIVFVFAEF